MKTLKRIIPICFAWNFMVLICFCFGENTDDAPMNAIHHFHGTGTEGDVSKEDLNQSLLSERNIDAMKSLLEAGADPNVFSKEGETPLIRTVKSLQIPTMKLLLEHGADPNIPDEKGFYPIILLNYHTPDSLPEYRLQMVELLLAHNAKIDVREPDYGRTPLMILSAYPQVVKLLIEKGADINARRFSEYQDRKTVGNNVLKEMADAGHEESVKILLHFQADTEGALCAAISSHHESIAKLLLASKCKVDLCALSAAVDQDQNDLLELMLEDLPNLNLQDINGENILMYAVEKNHPEAVDVILKHPIDVNAGDNQGKTALIYAADRGSFEMVKLLLAHAANPDIKDQFMRTALIVAVEKNDTNIARLLIESGADCVDNFTGNWKALLKAVELGNVSVVQMMLDKKARVDVRGDFDETPLMLAAFKGHLDVMNLLLDRGANIEAVNEHRPISDVGSNFIGTPLMWAIEGNQPAARELLLKRGANP